jgi:hypothetical protein
VIGLHTLSARFFALLTAAAAGCFCLMLAGCPHPRPAKSPAEPSPEPAPATPTPEPQPTPPPPPNVPYKRIELGKIFNGMQYKVTLETEHGTTATKDRNDPSSYVAELMVKVRVPKAHQSIDELQGLNPGIGSLLPALPQLLERAQVSPYFDDLYRLKLANMQTNLNRLDVVLSRHNFYDTETILELEHPETKRRALFIQADMDVDEDGSDPERVPEVDSSSLTFQPFTSYNWKRKTKAVNPFLPGREEALATAEKDLAKPGLTADRTKALKAQVEKLKSEIHSLKTFSFLVGAVDPFIVLPFSVVQKKSPFSPRVGDYCAVIHGDTIYPAIVGDVGPTYKMGEASLRICKEIHPRSASMFRPMNDLKITYLVFPGTADRPFGPPDLAKWRERTAGLIDELGGHQGRIFEWMDLTAPPPEPISTPTPPSVEASPQPPGEN